jgi:hypothetical protein
MPARCRGSRKPFFASTYPQVCFTKRFESQGMHSKMTTIDMPQTRDGFCGMTRLHNILDNDPSVSSSKVNPGQSARNFFLPLVASGYFPLSFISSFSLSFCSSIRTHISRTLLSWRTHLFILHLQAAPTNRLNQME